MTGVETRTRRFTWPGEVAQCDLWFPPVDVPLGGGQFVRLPALVMVTGYSRVITAMMLPSRQSPDLLCGHWELLRGWGVVPRVLVWDNESVGGRWCGGKPELTAGMIAFRGCWASRWCCAARPIRRQGLTRLGRSPVEATRCPRYQMRGVAEGAHRRSRVGHRCRNKARWRLGGRREAFPPENTASRHPVTGPEQSRGPRSTTPWRPCGG